MKVIVDYAHNAAAYRAIAATARNLTHGRAVGVVTAPGDRHDEDLADIGELCSQLFDELFIYEMDDLRDRAHGEACAAITSGISGDMHYRCIADVREALAEAVTACSEQDIVVFGCASHLSDVAEAARLLAARRRKRQTPSERSRATATGSRPSPY